MTLSREQIVGARAIGIRLSMYDLNRSHDAYIESGDSVYLSNMLSHLGHLQRECILLLIRADERREPCDRPQDI